MRQFKKHGAALLCGLALAGAASGAFAQQDDTYKISPDRDATPATTPQDRPALSAPPLPDRPDARTREQLQTLVAPIALYPDALVGQILAASAAPTQIVLANRWLKQHGNLRGEALAREVNQQPWDPAVRSLTQFPDVLANLDTNLSWTTALGDAYIQQPQDVLDAVQVLRQKAESAGTLRTTPQQTVTTQGQTIIIAPANPEIIYVPRYDPWLACGGPLLEYPGWIPYGGFYYGGPGITFGIGFGVGFFAGFGFGWNHWGANYHDHHVIYNHNTYITHGGGYHGDGGGYRGGSGYHNPNAYHAIGSNGSGAFHNGGSGYSGYRGGGSAASGSARRSGLSDYLNSRGSASARPSSGPRSGLSGYLNSRGSAGTGHAYSGSIGGASGFGRGGGGSSSSSGGGFRSSVGGSSRGSVFSGGRSSSSGFPGSSGGFSGSASRSGGGFSSGSSRSSGGFSGGSSRSGGGFSGGFSGRSGGGFSGGGSHGGGRR